MSDAANVPRPSITFCVPFSAIASYQSDCDGKDEANSS